MRRKASAASWANDASAASAAAASGSSGASDSTIARAGFSGPSAADYPHRGAIEKSFGAPLPATAHTGGAAARASEALGADGYALGDQVGFASASPSLELAAHEAAHVMQSTSGVQLHGGAGAHEDHADAVAARVVRGESAADLLAAGPAGASGASPQVHLQRTKNKKQNNKPGTRNREAKKRNETAEQLIKDLRALIKASLWKHRRKVLYPQESRKGIERIEQRKKGELPELTGLGATLAMSNFVDSMKSVQGGWSAMDREERGDAIFAAVNKALRGAGVEVLNSRTIEEIPEQGAFEASMWRIVLSQAWLDKASLGERGAASLSNTVLHEARHAEQHYLAARYIAGVQLPAKYPGAEEIGITAQAISTKHDLPLYVAREAVIHKLHGETDSQVAALGAKMYTAHVSDGSQNQKISDNDYAQELEQARQTAQRALELVVKDPSGGNARAARVARAELREALAEFDRRYRRYRDIPYESDAHEVGDAVERLFLAPDDESSDSSSV